MTNVMMLSREVKRVPLDFDAPIGETWAPLLGEQIRFPGCPTCGPEGRGSYGASGDDVPIGDGLTPGARQIDRSWYALDVGQWTPEGERLRDAYRWDNKLTQDEVDHLIEKGRLPTWVDGEDGARGRWERLPRLAEDVNAERFAHDAINQGICVRYRCERLGIELNCPTCHGHGDIATDEEREARDAWEPPEVPVGDGWQMWQSVSEGGPISPVFETKLELAEWLATNEKVCGFAYLVSEWLSIIDGQRHGLEIGSGNLV